MQRKPGANPEIVVEPGANPEIVVDPNAPPAVAPGVTPPVEPTPPQDAGDEVFTEIERTKGTRDPKAIAKMYLDEQKELSKRGTTIDKIKQQLQTLGATVDENGNIITGQGAPGTTTPTPGYTPPIQTGAPVGVPPVQPPYGQPAPTEDMYDAYGTLVVDPVEKQILQQYPQSTQLQRISYVTNLQIQQDRTNQQNSETNKSKTLARDEARGYEDDIKKVMAQVPIAQHTAEAWERAMWEVRGRRASEDIKRASAKGVDDFLNKDSLQNIPATGATQSDKTKLSPEDEAKFRSHQKLHANDGYAFKDRADFLGFK